MRRPRRLEPIERLLLLDAGVPSPEASWLCHWERDCELPGPNFLPGWWWGAIESCPAVPRLLVWVSWEDRRTRGAGEVVAFFWRNPGSILHPLLVQGSEEYEYLKSGCGTQKGLTNLISELLFPTLTGVFQKSPLLISTCESFHLCLAVHVYNK